MKLGNYGNTEVSPSVILCLFLTLLNLVNGVSQVKKDFSECPFLLSKSYKWGLT